MISRGDFFDIVSRMAKIFNDPKLTLNEALDKYTKYEKKFKHLYENKGR